MPEFPAFIGDHRLSDDELTIAVAQAILDSQFNPGMDQAFNPDAEELLNRLGGVPRGNANQNALRQSFSEANPTPEFNFRLAEYCWRLVGLGFLVPEQGGRWGAFLPTERGRKYLQSLDSTAITTGGLDAKLGSLGLAYTDLPRQYSRLAQDCFLAGHYASAVVMLGVACEALIGDVAQALSVARPRSFATARTRPSHSTARIEIAWIDEVLRDHRRVIRTALQAVSADDSWVEPLRDLLAGTGQSIRLTRNDSGHPTGIVVSREEALELLTLFPRFAGACVLAVANLAKI